MLRPTYKIDATDKVLGRLATEIAVLLMGKNTVAYRRDRDMGGVVEISNCEKVKLTGAKLLTKKYYRHSGYPGGLKEKTASAKLAEEPSFLIYHAVYNMIPDNRTRPAIMKRLKFVAK